uniref:G-protein coupled receptors family 1 profile domain-containing protein n=1 Tax=Meloidogyne javanica TaxID=6303 RepID=A0A915MNA9_MELJA
MNLLRYLIALNVILSNGFLLFLFIRHRSLRNTQCNLLIAANAVIEMIIGIGLATRGTFEIYTSAVSLTSFTHTLCVWIGSPLTGGFAANQVTILGLALDRLTAVARPFSYGKKNKPFIYTCYLLIILIFIGAVFISLWRIDESTPSHQCSMGANAGPLFATIWSIYAQIITFSVFSTYIGMLILFYRQNRRFLSTTTKTKITQVAPSPRQMLPINGENSPVILDYGLEASLKPTKSIENASLEEKNQKEENGVTFPAEGHEIVETKKEINSPEEVTDSTKGQENSEDRKVTMNGDESEADKLNNENVEGEEKKATENKNEEFEEKEVLQDEKTKEEEDKISIEPVKTKEIKSTSNDKEVEDLKEEEEKVEVKGDKDEEENKEENKTKDEKKVPAVIEGEKKTPKEKEHKSHWFMDKFKHAFCFITRYFYCPSNSAEKDKEFHREGKESHRGKRFNSDFSSLGSDEEMIENFENAHGFSEEIEENGEFKAKMNVGATYFKAETDNSGKMRGKIENFNAEMHN